VRDANGSGADKVLQHRYLDFYNSRRPHTGLDRRTPDQAYFNQPPFRMAA
jgi:hypothetical protein